LKCLQYKLAAIAKRLGLPKPHGLRSLAFEMVMDPHGSFRELLRQGTSLSAITLYSNRYQEFSGPYNHLNPDMRISSPISQDCMDSQLRLRWRLQTLDPRVSEFILQCPTLARIAGLTEIQHSAINAKSTINVFLPFLLDCPIRTSAWEMSVPVRQLAYGLVNLVIPEEERITTVIEHRRQQHGNRGREWQVPNIRDISATCISLVHTFEKIRSDVPNLSKNEFWQTVAVHQDFVQASSQNKPALSNMLMGAPSSGKISPFRLTWDGIQLFNQLQGSFYSFRILKQILELVLLCNDSERLPSVLHGLQYELEALPPLEELPEVVESIRRFGSQEDYEIIDMVRKLLNLETDEIVVKSTSTKQHKKKRKQSWVLKDLESSSKRPNNMFELLSTE
jgi:hypothetical protein